MVKKGSFFSRIFGKGTAGREDAEKTRNRAGGAAAATATVPKRSAAGRGPAAGTAAPPKEAPPKASLSGEKKEQKEVPLRPEILKEDEGVRDEGAREFKVITKKLSEQEEMSIKISQGLKGLSSVLGDIDERLKDQARTGTEIVTTVRTIPEMLKDLPESSRVGLELLNGISRIIDQQSRGVEDLSEKMTSFTSVVGDLGEKIERDSQERVQDIKVFRDSLGSVRKSVLGLSEQQARINEKQVANFKSIAAAVKKTSEEQRRKIETIAGRMKIMNFLVIFLMLVIIAGIVALVLVLK